MIKVKSPESGRAIHKRLKDAGITTSSSYIEVVDDESVFFISLNSLLSKKALSKVLKKLPYQASLV